MLPKQTSTQQTGADHFARWLSRLGFLSLLALAGLVYEKRAQLRFRARTKPPGRLYDIGGRRLHLICNGDRRPGQPLVVLEAGHGSWSSCWQKVMPEVAKHARVCAYDRAGYGWSDPAPGNAYPERIVADLRALLKQAGEAGPYLLVGHSMGGALSRLFTTLHPEDVVGMVWVDSVQEDLPAYLPAGRWAFTAVQYGALFGALLAQAGFMRFSGLGRFIAKYPSVQGASDAHALVEQVSQPGYMRVLAAETRTLADASGWRRVRSHFGRLPIISLEACYAERPPIYLPASFWQKFRSGWHTMHDHLAERADNLKRIPVECGHVIMDERPEQVIQAVLDLLNEVKSQDHN